MERWWLGGCVCTEFSSLLCQVNHITTQPSTRRYGNKIWMREVKRILLESRSECLKFEFV